MSGAGGRGDHDEETVDHDGLADHLRALEDITRHDQLGDLLT
jgi:hypothetical protein